MRIFLAGGTGVIGRRLIPELAAAGHEVVATTRSAASLESLTRLGASGVVVDVYDDEHLTEVVGRAAPDLVVHQLTDLRRFDADANARVRRRGTAHLVSASQDAGVGRIVVQSIAWAYQDGPGLAVEDDPIERGSAVEAMEEMVRAIPSSTVLRYGWWYGPGTWYAPGGRIATSVAEGLMPATRSINSLVYLDDAVAATIQAIEWPDGVYNIVDDEPAPATEWLPVYAAAIGAPAPTSSRWTENAPGGRGVSNVKAKAAGWAPRFPSWRVGFSPEVLRDGQ